MISFAAGIRNHHSLITPAEFEQTDWCATMGTLMASTASGLAPVLDLARILASVDARQAVAAWHATEADAAQPVA